MKKNPERTRPQRTLNVLQACTHHKRITPIIQHSNVNHTLIKPILKALIDDKLLSFSGKCYYVTPVGYSFLRRRLLKELEATK